jgi:hypothetical protein
MSEGGRPTGRSSACSAPGRLSDWSVLSGQLKLLSGHPPGSDAVKLLALAIHFAHDRVFTIIVDTEREVNAVRNQ